jgi:hypothetical protein
MVISIISQEKAPADAARNRPEVNGGYILSYQGQLLAQGVHFLEVRFFVLDAGFD